MNHLDVFILIVLTVGLGRGLFTGIVRQVFGLVGWILSFILATVLMEPVGAWVAGIFDMSMRLGAYVGFVLVFALVQLAVFFAIRFAEELLGILKLSSLNRVAGGLTGALKYALYLSLVFALLGFLGVPSADTRAQSFLYEPVSSVLPAAWNFTSEVLPVVKKLPGELRTKPEPESDSGEK